MVLYVDIKNKIEPTLYILKVNFWGMKDNCENISIELIEDYVA